MSNKAMCPACDAYTSSVWIAQQDGDPCPNCGLSAAAAIEVELARKRGADEHLVEMAAKAEQRAEAAESESRRLTALLNKIGSLVNQQFAPR